MCGICGKINLDEGKPVDSELISKMCDAIRHRGPDDDGYFVQQNVGLGMRRLSIIDLNTGKQPIFNEDGTIVIVFNGEIYNFQELRKELIAKGHRFRTNSDTESIVHLYEEKGEECIHDLRGMFGFAIYDMRLKKLVLARDRFGIKPMYYSFNGKSFTFGSELKSLLQDDTLDREFDFTALNCYFSFMNTIAPDSIFKQVKKLQPGHYLVFKDGNYDIYPYWQFYLRASDVKRSESDIEHELVERLREAVKIRLISDVPLGAFLSGGIDSSSIVALMSEVSDRPVKTFSIGFKDKDYNELEFARIVAQRYATDHHEYVVEPDATRLIDDLVWYLDEPFADPSAIPTYFVSKIARENVTVVLTGDGGDEMFGGYPHYHAEALLANLGKIPPFMRNNVLKPLAQHFPTLPIAKMNYQKQRFLRNLERIGVSPQSRFFSRHQVFTPDEKNRLYADSFLDRLNGSFDIESGVMHHFNMDSSLSSLDQLLYLDTHIYLPNDMLMKVDRMSMANSLEARVPFLDHVFAEFVSTIPAHLKVRGRETKYILKKAMSRYLSDDILYRKKKGFDMPLDVWFRNGLDEMAAEILLDQQCIRRNLLKKQAIEQIIATHKSKEKDLSFQIWTLIVFEKWCQAFIDRN
ncbi:asparagine synthase (glutamine-hydrolyzing) [candidate division KSB1 bacterium]|nr:asparagine synthase (glutamine-hydrolyzing) [candidate division KSB1 bacterium]